MSRQRRKAVRLSRRVLIRPRHLPWIVFVLAVLLSLGSLRFFLPASGHGIMSASVSAAITGVIVIISARVADVGFRRNRQVRRRWRMISATPPA